MKVFFNTRNFNNEILIKFEQFSFDYLKSESFEICHTERSGNRRLFLPAVLKNYEQKGRNCWDRVCRAFHGYIVGAEA